MQLEGQEKEQAKPAVPFAPIEPIAPEAEKAAFCKTLDTIYRRSKQESRAGFPHITALTEQGEGERHE